MIAASLIGSFQKVAAVMVSAAQPDDFLPTQS
jgi:hypothetical protein